MPTIPTIVPLATTIALLMATVGCTASLSPQSRPTKPLDLVVLHTNDNWGETNPCG